MDYIQYNVCEYVKYMYDVCAVYNNYNYNTDYYCYYFVNIILILLIILVNKI